MWRQIIAVLVGGVIGTGARLGVDLLLTHATPGSLAWSTVVVNVGGSFLLGLLVSTLWRRPGFPVWARAGLGTGVLGSFTTFSAMAVNSVAGAVELNLVSAVGALVLSLVLGLLAAWGGLALGGRGLRSPEIPDAGEDI